VEALAHDQGDAFLAGQHVDQLDLDPGPVGAGEGGVQVLLDGLAAAVGAGQRGSAGDVQDDVVGEEAEAGVPVAALHRLEVAAHDIEGSHSRSYTQLHSRRLSPGGTP
jgi:hypothetical protein